MCLRDTVLQLAKRDWFSTLKATKGLGVNSVRVLCFQRWTWCVWMHTGAQLLGRQVSSFASSVESQQFWRSLWAVFYQSCAENCRVPSTSQAQVLLVKIPLPCALLIVCCSLAHKTLCCFALKCPFVAICSACHWLLVQSPGARQLPHQNTGKTRLWDQQPSLIQGLFSENGSIRRNEQAPVTSGDTQDP